MDPTEVVTVFLRNDAEVLLFERSEAVGSYPGKWGAVAGHAEGDPDEMARREIEEETGIGRERTTLVRRGEPFRVTDDDLETVWLVHPYLFDVETRAVEPNWETTAVEWVSPTELLRRETVPELWTSYDRVRPSVETVAGDTEHGSAYISIRALEVLRDEAGLAVLSEGDWSALVRLALDLRDARPDMAAVRNRIDRVMHRATTDSSPEAVHESALEGLDVAIRADDEAAQRVGREIGGKRVFTLSRSGTVLSALIDGEPARVTVAESRPGGEGRTVAETLSEAGLDVVLTSDANVPAAVESTDVVLVGADTVFSNGDVLNKVGTTAAMLAGRYYDVDRFVVCARDKISPTASNGYEADDTELESLYNGEAAIEVRNPTFERVPRALISAVVTESGTLDPGAISTVADDLEALGDWVDEVQPS